MSVFIYFRIFTIYIGRDLISLRVCFTPSILSGNNSFPLRVLATAFIFSFVFADIEITFDADILVFSFFIILLI